MSIPTIYITKMLKKLSNYNIDNLIAQTDARRILQEVKESINNFPNFDPLLTEKAIHIAYSFISCGCSLIENKDTDTEDGLLVLEKAGNLLSNALSYSDYDSEFRDFHILIAGMALYSAKQYSYAFIVLKNIKINFSVGQLIHNFIRKDFTSLMNNINVIMLSSVVDEIDYEDVSQEIISFEIARIFSIVFDFIQSGNKGSFNLINTILDKIQIIAYEDNMTSYWLIIRLLRIILLTYQKNSIWSVVPPLLPVGSNTDRYIRLLSNFRPPVTELWPSQIESLPLALGVNKGAIINLRTSAGKTRIAEISILKILSTQDSCKVLYLAPFRSLAFEIEQNLSKTFTPLGINVSQLYGGATANVTDLELINESKIIVATPEKAKALIRSGSGLESELRLIVIDEGHLFGSKERETRNEMFITHIKEYSTRNNIKLLLLSAVLPNADQLAQWITDDANLVSKSDWKPAREKLGLLLWNGNRVRLEWQGNGNPYNPIFIKSGPLGFSRRRNPFPHDKNEAIAATAVKLSSNGTVMIYSARANSIDGLAEDVLLALGEHPDDFPWDESLWAVFDNICHEELEDNDIILISARKGIICHSNRLPSLVRIAIERLMRSNSPLIIIASSTLGQGVNIGISTVIISTPYFTEETIDHRDFWNICGRAGRAFSDIEGKILYAIDTKITPDRKKWQVNKDYKLANGYFDKSKIECVYSGVIEGLRAILQYSLDAKVDFEILLESIANDFANEKKFDLPENYKKIFEYMDDELLAMHEEFGTGDNDLSWIEEVFKKSLAIIQAEKDYVDIYLEMIKSRTSAIIKCIQSKPDRKKIVSSGLSFSVSKSILENIDFFKNIAESVIQDIENGENRLVTISAFIRKIEVWSIENASSIIKATPLQISILQTSLDNIRHGWISGEPLRELKQIDSEIDTILKDYYGFTLPWIIHAISKMFDPSIDEAIVQLYSETALFVELGLPNDIAVNIYLAGIRSRSVALELSEVNIFKDKRTSEVKKILLDPFLDTSIFSKETKVWIDLLLKTYQPQQIKKIGFPQFSLKGRNLPEKLYLRRKDDQFFLISSDGYFKKAVESTAELPFENISNMNGLYFESEDDIWILRSYNPLIEIV